MAGGRSVHHNRGDPAASDDHARGPQEHEREGREHQPSEVPEPGHRRHERTQAKRKR